MTTSISSHTKRANTGKPNQKALDRLAVRFGLWMIFTGRAERDAIALSAHKKNGSTKPTQS